MDDHERYALNTGDVSQDVINGVRGKERSVGMNDLIEGLA